VNIYFEEFQILMPNLNTKSKTRHLTMKEQEDIYHALTCRRRSTVTDEKNIDLAGICKLQAEANEDKKNYLELIKCNMQTSKKRRK